MMLYLDSKIKSPCYGCTERHEACWRKCEKYKDFKKKSYEMKKLVNSEKHNSIKAYTYDKITESIKLKNARR